MKAPLSGDPGAPRVPRSSADPGRAPRLLVTGFGPFPGITDNPSGRFAREIDGARVAGVAIVGRVVPVEWGRAWPAIVAHLDALRPDALLMLGVARDRAQVEVELWGRNRNHPVPDAADALPPEALISPDGPAARPSRLPVEALMGPGVGRSTDAGGYLCNHVLYRALESGPPCCGFVHVPAFETPATRQLVDALARWLATERRATRG